MQLDELIGHLAIRTMPVSEDNDLFTDQPVLVLSTGTAKNVPCAIIILLSETGEYESGTTLTLSAEFMDDNWADFGEIVNKACQTKAQILKLLVNLLGLNATEQELFKLSQVLSYKQLLCELSDLSDADLLSFLSDEKPAQPVAEPRLPEKSGFVRRD